MLSRRRRRRTLRSSPFAKLTQKLLGGHKKRVLLEDAADDDHRMRPYDVDNRVPAKFRKVIHTDDRIVVTTPHIIHTRLELNEIVDVRSTAPRKVHLTD